jgi:rhodanese-related sulfurtransferase
MMNRVTCVLTTLLTLSLAVGEAHAQGSSNPPSPGREVAVEGRKYTALTVPEYRAMSESTDFLVVNVHVPFEGDLPGTEASIPFDHVTAHLDRLPADRSAKILLYCKSGRMSAIAATELAKLGYTAVHDLLGGFNAWVAAGHPMAAR